MPPDSLLPALITIGMGALAGGITNAVAIWMLFRPYEPLRLGLLTLQGAIPKNKARLARTIGRTVGERLLTAEDLSLRLAAPPVRDAFARAIRDAVTDVLETDHGPLAERLAPEALAAVEQAIDELGPRAADRIAATTTMPAFGEAVARWRDRLAADLADTPVGTLLTPDRRTDLAERLNRWAADLAESPDLETTLRGWVAGWMGHLAEEDRPLLDRLPDGLLQPLEQALGDALPGALDRLGEVLADPEAKLEIRRALRDAFDGSARELLIHERLVAKLVVNDRTLARLVDGFEGEGFERITATLTAPAMRERIGRAVREGLESSLRMPLRERFARLGPDRRAALERTAGDWLVAAARNEGTRAVLRATLERALTRARDRTWDEVLTALPAERIAAVLAEALSGPGGRRWVGELVSTTGRGLLRRPLGRPADWLGEEDVRRLTDGIADAAWRWVQEQVPQVVERLRLPEMVEQKVLGFSTDRMEEIVRTVTDRELRLIVRLGYVLGAIVGLIAFGVQLLV